MYRFDFTVDAERDLDRLDPPIRTRILKRLAWLATTPRMRNTSFWAGRSAIYANSAWATIAYFTI